MLCQSGFALKKFSSNHYYIGEGCSCTKINDFLFIEPALISILQLRDFCM